MAERARLAPARPEREHWPWHQVKMLNLPVKAFFGGDRRMEAERYLLSGYGLRAALQAADCVPLEKYARVWQPSRLKGILVSPEFGTPFLAATQVFDLRPVPRKWLAMRKVKDPASLYVQSGMILVTRSGTVGRATLAYTPHLDTVISDDLLRVEAKDEKHWGWIYAYLRAPSARAMMTSAQYGHIIKHLETGHLGALPIPDLDDETLDKFTEQSRSVLTLREEAHAATIAAEERFEHIIGKVEPISTQTGFLVPASDIFGTRRRLEAAFFSPTASAIVARFRTLGLTVHTLASVSERVWWMTRFSRVFGEDGVPYMSAEELFALNPTIDKRIMIQQAKSAEAYFAKDGWIFMACSGQVYGLLGSVALMTEKHEQAFFSHDLIRIAPRREDIRPGYLYTALGHPRLGRPLVSRYAYGTSIPHLEPTDIQTLPIVRLTSSDEDFIADMAETAAEKRAEADLLENAMAGEAEEILQRIMAHGRLGTAPATDGAKQR